ncbi:MoaD/ThiS family protein [Kocuria nitroreducens]|uniref:MoaD/ThiS family protein n=1 Tax=Kocuria nitroreducens TaxID=3058914 RepID=UPI0036DCCC3C
MTHQPAGSTPGIPAPDTGAVVQVRFFAAARAAAGTEAETVALDGPVLTRREVEELLARAHRQPAPGRPPLAQVLARASFLLDGVACPDPDTEVPAGAVLDVLPPFSGG